MKLELNTDLCPIVVPDTYGSGFCNMVEDNMWEDFKKLMVDKAEYIFSMWVMYRQYRENDIKAFQNEYLDDVEEYAGGNGYFIDEEDEDEEMY